MKKIIIFLLFTIALIFLVSFIRIVNSAAAGPNSPISVNDSSDIGTLVWTTPSNSTSSNNNYTTVTISSVSTVRSHWLKSGGHGFSIPSTSDINGIMVEVERSLSTTSGVTGIADTVSLVKSENGGSIYNKTNDTTWTTTDTYVSFGNSTDLWNTTWAVSDINEGGGNSNWFGIRYAVNGSGSSTFDVKIDHTRITVFYTDRCAYSGSGDWTVDSADNCVLSTNTDIGSNTLFLNGTTGSTTIDAIIQAGKIRISQGTIVKINQSKMLIAKQI